MKLPTIESLAIVRETSFGWSNTLKLEMRAAGDRFGMHSVEDVALVFSWAAPSMGTQSTGHVYVALDAFMPSCGAGIERVDSVAKIMRAISNRCDKMSAKEGYPSSMAEHAIRFWRAIGEPTVKVWNATEKQWSVRDNPAESLRFHVMQFERERDTCAENDVRIVAAQG